MLYKYICGYVLSFFFVTVVIKFLITNNQLGTLEEIKKKIDHNSKNANGLISKKRKKEC